MRISLLLLFASFAARAQPDVSQVVIVPRLSTTGVVVTISGGTPAAGTSLIVSARDANGNVVFRETRMGVTEDVVDVGDLSVTPSGIVKVSVATSNAYATHATQTFFVNANIVTYISSLVWVPSGDGFELSAIPSSKLPATARWSARCSGVPSIVGRPWADRRVAAANTHNCVAAVTLDAAGFVTTDPMVIIEPTLQTQTSRAPPSRGFAALIACSALAAASCFE